MRRVYLGKTNYQYCVISNRFFKFSLSKGRSRASRFWTMPLVIKSICLVEGSLNINWLSNPKVAKIILIIYLIDCMNTTDRLQRFSIFFFFFSPTTLDSKVFSYVAIMLKIPLPVNKLKSRILEYPKLEQYCDKILHLYFPTGELIRTAFPFVSNELPWIKLCGLNST